MSFLILLDDFTSYRLYEPLLFLERMSARANRLSPVSTVAWNIVFVFLVITSLVFAIAVSVVGGNDTPPGNSICAYCSISYPSRVIFFRKSLNSLYGYAFGLCFSSHSDRGHCR